jgi:hypothetical protein
LAKRRVPLKGRKPCKPPLIGTCSSGINTLLFINESNCSFSQSFTLNTLSRTLLSNREIGHQKRTGGQREDAVLGKDRAYNYGKVSRTPASLLRAATMSSTYRWCCSIAGGMGTIGSAMQRAAAVSVPPSPSPQDGGGRPTHTVGGAHEYVLLTWIPTTTAFRRGSQRRVRVRRRIGGTAQRPTSGERHRTPLQTVGTARPGGIRRRAVRPAQP